MKIKVLITHPIYYYVPIFKLLTEKGFSIKVLYFSTFGLKKGFDREFGIQLKWYLSQDILEGYDYKFLWNPFSGFSTPSFRDFAPGIIKEIIKKDYDYFWIVNWNTITHWIAFLFLILFKRKIILRAENPYNQEILKPKIKLFIRKIIFEKIIFPRIDYFLYIGENHKNFYIYYKVPEYKLIFAPYAVDNDLFRNEYQKLKDKKKDLRKNFNIDINDVVILFVGKFIEKKRPLDLLRAYEKLFNEKNIRNISLVYVGEGELRKKLEEFIKEKNLTKVYLMGFQNQQEISKFYTIADIFVLPSGIGETWGLVVNEAMNFELPIIVSDLVGCGLDLVKHNENGYIFKFGDIDELARYLKNLISDYNLRKEFGRKSFEIVKNYSFQKSAENVFNFLKND